jgi:hypothetical protein
VQYSSGPIRAEARLARPHAQPQVAAQIVEHERARLAQRGLHLRARHQFALTHDLTFVAGFDFAQPLAQRMKFFAR